MTLRFKRIIKRRTQLNFVNTLLLEFQRRNCYAIIFTRHMALLLIAYRIFEFTISQRRIPWRTTLSLVVHLKLNELSRAKSIRTPWVRNQIRTAMPIPDFSPAVYFDVSRDLYVTIENDNERDLRQRREALRTIIESVGFDLACIESESAHDDPGDGKSIDYTQYLFPSGEYDVGVCTGCA